MVVEIRPLAQGLTNQDYLNAFRRTQGDDYRSRIPEATQANIQDTIQSLMDYSPGRNAFIDALINKIGLTLFKNQSWSNPLAQFKRGMLRYGESIEEIMTGLIPATAYDPNRDDLEREIFGQEKPEVTASYHVRNRQDRYKLTVKSADLHAAFNSDSGLNTFIANLMGMAQTSDQNDEYLIMSRLFAELDKAAGDQGIYNVNVPDVGLQDSDGPDSRFVLRRLREFSNTLPFISRLYNPAGMPAATRPEDLILFTTATADAAMDVEALAAAFNISKAEFGSRKVVLPQKDFGISGVQAILTTKDFFVCADTRIETTSIQNPAGLFNNYWLHHWGVYSASRMAPFVMFNSERPSTVIAQEITPVSSVSAFTITDENGVAAPTNVERALLYNVAVSAVTNPAGGSNDAVRYELVGALSRLTRITNNGVLYVGPDEAAQTLTINAYAVDTAIPQVVGTTSRTVVGTLVNPWAPKTIVTDVDKDALEEPVLNANTLQMDGNKKVKIPSPTAGYTLTRTIKEGVTFTDTGDVVGVAKHGAESGDTVVFGAITGTTGITASTTYYVKDVINADSFTVAATAGGAVLPLTTNGTAVSAQFVAKDGKTYTIAGLTDFVATAEAGHEIAAGSTTLWTFDN